MTCGEMDMLVHPFLDGELVDEERVRIEKHAAACERCRGLVNHEVTFRQNLRARLRPRPGHGVHGGAGDGINDKGDSVPPELRQRVVAALDRADAQGDGPARSIGRLLAPGLGALATAAAIALFFGARGGDSLGRPADGLVEQAIAGHMKNLPVEMQGTDAEITTWMVGKIPVAVRPPRIQVSMASRSDPQVMRVGARIYHLGNRDAGQIIYRMEGAQLTVYVFDPSGWDGAALAQGHGMRMIDGRNVYFAEQAGYSVALYRDRGVGYALASDLDEDSLLAVVASALQEDSRK